MRIAGSGPNEKEYKKLTEDLNISNIVKWLGFISQEKVASEWANMDLGIGVDPYYFTYEAEKIGIS